MRAIFRKSLVGQSSILFRMARIFLHHPGEAEVIERVLRIEFHRAPVVGDGLFGIFDVLRQQWFRYGSWRNARVGEFTAKHSLLM